MSKYKTARVRVLFLFCLILFTTSIYAQSDTIKADTLSDSLKNLPPPPKWKMKVIYALNGTQSSFMNWNAGGRTNVSLLGFVSASAYYSDKNIKWENDFNFAMGGIRYISKLDEIKTIQKTDDRIDFATKLGVHSKKKFYFSIIGGFKTQSLDGFSSPTDTIRISTFMAPGYINLAIGYDYVPGDNFGVFLSPLAAKMTFVQDQNLANLGAFGVDKAVYNDLGAIIQEGKQYRGEFGAYFKVKWNKVLAKNIDMKTKLDLFSNYKKNPENIDVTAEAIFTFKVNSWFTSSLQWNLIYDDDIDIKDALGNVGPRTQLKSVVGMGISYTMKNYVDKKPAS